MKNLREERLETLLYNAISFMIETMVEDPDLGMKEMCEDIAEYLGSSVEELLDLEVLDKELTLEEEEENEMELNDEIFEAIEEEKLAQTTSQTTAQTTSQSLYDAIHSIDPITQNEFTVYDQDYEMEAYFYNDLDRDSWGQIEDELAKKLTIKEVITEEWGDKAYVVNMYELIEKNLQSIRKIVPYDETWDAEDIMDGMGMIIAGYAQEEYYKNLVDAITEY